MKQIYVYKQMIGNWKGITKEESENKIKEGHVIGAELEMNRGEDEPIKITLLKDRWMLCGFGVSDEEIQQLVDEYFNYVEEITGMVSKPA